ncbi:hypothetical protein A2311_04665 [candidate division WOR-1 bacterium RIFOXYB2_FULL_48_7]|uniref:Uncharacterized protein n=1 Tax=candidate division WOR-1 bacterium RIFOXYB2_FULL_48_7 TaxID=1802583 RepID=A0A1F4TRZ2_UNCSA|nr:MAG: hypothetical protein A2311_04665 [candidate division WOR-1 bacterium RIFOXYB2_FULL_48_7]
MNIHNTLTRWRVLCLIVGAWLLVIVAVGGCARTVTSIVSYGDQMVVEVTLRGTMDPNQNRYYLVLSTNEAFQVPLPPPDNIAYEFIEPGIIPQLGNLVDYYTNYYSTWSGYIITEPGGHFVTPGPFIQGQTTSQETIGSITVFTTKIQYYFRLSQVFGSNVPNTIYFDFVSVDNPVSGPKMAADHLNSTNAYIAKIIGSQITVADEANGSLTASTDILECKVNIQ